MKEKYFVNQTSINDCGAACLTMILNLRGIKVSLNEIKNNLNITKEGISAYEIIKLSKKYNVKAAGYKNVELDDINSPVIAHLINKDNLQHFVVILKVLKDKVLLADPASKVMYVKKDEFSKRYTKVAIIFEDVDNILSILTSNKIIILKLLVTTFLFTIFSLFFSYLISFLIKITETDINNKLLVIYFLIFIVLSSFKDFINYLRTKLAFKFQLLIDKLITIPVIEKLISLPHKYYHANGSGQLISKINDLSYLKEMLFKIVEVLFVNIVLIIFSLCLVLFLKPSFLVINLFIFLVFFVTNKMFLKKYSYDFYDLQIENANLNNKIVDSFNSILSIKNLSKEKYFKDKLTNIYNEFLNKYKKLFTHFYKKEFLISLIISYLTIVLLFFMFYQELSLVRIIFIFNLENIIVNSLNEIFTLQPLYSDFKSTLLRIKEIYSYKIYNNDSFIDINNIKFKNFYYKYNDKVILNKINFEINKGDFVMIYGPVGTGKSTLFKILTNQIDYDGNNIFINNININNISKDEIRNSIVYVEQKIRLFNDTIKNNIFMGMPIDKKVLLAADIKQILKENNISLDYVIDNTNSNLSSGQISKIAIAQALNCNKDIIIFDETTSSLDVDSERLILNNIKNNYKDKTIILISHRTSNIDLFNKVINFKKHYNKIKKGEKNEKIK